MALITTYHLTVFSVDPYSLEIGIGLFNGLFNFTCYSYMFQIALYIISIIILQLTVLYNQKSFVTQFSSLQKTLHSYSYYVHLALMDLTFYFWGFIFLIYHFLMYLPFYIFILVSTAIILFVCLTLTLTKKMQTNKPKNSKRNIVYIIKNKIYFDLYVSLLLLRFNPTFLLCILFIFSLLIRVSLTLNYDIIYELLREILPINNMMDGPQYTGVEGGVQSNNTNMDYPENLSTQSTDVSWVKPSISTSPENIRESLHKVRNDLEKVGNALKEKNTYIDYLEKKIAEEEKKDNPNLISIQNMTDDKNKCEKDELWDKLRRKVLYGKYKELKAKAKAYNKTIEKESSDSDGDSYSDSD